MQDEVKSNILEVVASGSIAPGTKKCWMSKSIEIRVLMLIMNGAKTEIAAASRRVIATTIYCPPLSDYVTILVSTDWSVDVLCGKIQEGSR
jgi:hypothetical protein